jgi:hypothetical protein
VPPPSASAPLGEEEQARPAARQIAHTAPRILEPTLSIVFSLCGRPSDSFFMAMHLDEHRASNVKLKVMAAYLSL